MNHRRHSIRGTLLLTVGGLTLIIALLAVYETIIAWNRLVQMQQLKSSTEIGDLLFDAAAALGAERGTGLTLMRTADRGTALRLQPQLTQNRTEADRLLRLALESLRRDMPSDLAETLQQLEMHWNSVQNFRRHIDREALLPRRQRDKKLADRWFSESTALILQTQLLWMDYAARFTTVEAHISLHMRFKHILSTILEFTGRERSLIGRLIAENAAPSPEDSANLLLWRGNVEHGWSIAATLAKQSGLTPAITPYLNEAQSQQLSLRDMVGDPSTVSTTPHDTPYPIGIEMWLGIAAQTADSLTALKEATRDQTWKFVKTREREAAASIAMHTILLLAALGLCFSSFRVITRRVITPINAMADALTEAASADQTEESLDEIEKLERVLQVFRHNADELHHYATALERSNKELDDFAYIASHDLKEPLRGLHNHSRFLLEDNEDKLDEESAKRLRRLVALSQRMEHLVNDLLYFSRLGRQDMAIQPTDMNAVIRDIENTLETFIEDRQAHLAIPDPLPTVICDKPRVTEVFRNLITNAIKYNDKPEKTVEIGYLPEREAFFVRDNGIGIAAEFHQEIFRIFKRLQPASGTPEEGTGVGLTFVRKIIDRHGGNIWLESAPGNGTTFYFTLKEQDHEHKAAA